MRTSSPIFAVFVLASLFGCSAPRHHVSSEPPAIVIDQMPDYPMPGRGSEFPGGLVAAMWRDGRLIRATASSAVGKSYVEGVVAPKEREEFFSILGTATGRAPKIDGIPLHDATQTITIRSESRTSEWTRILPDTESVWAQVQSRLLSLPLQNRHAIDSEIAENVR